MKVTPTYTHSGRVKTWAGMSAGRVSHLSKPERTKITSGDEVLIMFCPIDHNGLTVRRITRVGKDGDRPRYYARVVDDVRAMCLSSNSHKEDKR